MQIVHIYFLLVPATLLALFAGLVLAMLLNDWRAARRDGVLALGMILLSAAVMLGGIWVVVSS